MNLIFTRNVKGTVTMDLVDISLRDALNLVIKTNKLYYDIKANTLVVSTEDAAMSLADRNKNLTVIPVKYVNALALSSFLNESVFSPKGKSASNPGMSNGFIVATNPANNSLIVTGTDNDIALVRRVVDQFDKKPAITTFKVNHTTPAEMASAVCTSLFPSMSIIDTDSSGSSSGGAAGIPTGFASDSGSSSSSSSSGGSSSTSISVGGGKLACALSATQKTSESENGKETFKLDSLPLAHHLTITGFLSLVIAFIAVLIPTGFSPNILPIPAYIIILSIFTNARIAFFAATVLLSILIIGLHYPIEFVATFLLLNTVSMIAISKMKFSRRFDLILTGLKISLAGAIIVLSIFSLEQFLIDVDNVLILRDVFLIFVNGILSGIIALGTLPILESTFGIITPYGLAELADHNQPLLKRLQFEAPGTYHHSLMVSNLAEAAAEAIGANPILARVGSDRKSTRLNS